MKQLLTVALLSVVMMAAGKEKDYSRKDKKMIENYQQRIQMAYTLKKECACDKYDHLIKEGIKRVDSIVLKNKMK